MWEKFEFGNLGLCMKERESYMGECYRGFGYFKRLGEKNNGSGSEFKMGDL